MDLVIIQWWSDIRLAQGQDRTFSFSGNDIKKIWTPDTIFLNAKQSEIKNVSYILCSQFITLESQIITIKKVCQRFTSIIFSYIIGSNLLIMPNFVSRYIQKL